MLAPAFVRGFCLPLATGSWLSIVFVRAAVFLHAHAEIFHSKKFLLHNLRIAVSLLFGNDGLLTMIFCAFWIEKILHVLLLFSFRHCRLLTNHYLFCCCFELSCLFLFVALAERNHICRKAFPFSLCSLQIAHCADFVDDYELCDVSVSLFAVELRCASV